EENWLALTRPGARNVSGSPPGENRTPPKGGGHLFFPGLLLRRRRRSLGIMLRLGRVYRGMMVNMQTTNTKLKRRAEVMIARIAGCSQADAASPPTNWFGTAMPLVSKWPATFELNGFLFDLPERTTVCSVVICSRPLRRRDDKQNDPNKYGQQNRQGH